MRDDIIYGNDYKGIKFLKLGFENVEVIVFPGSAVNRIYLSDIELIISGKAYDGFTKGYTVNTVYVEIMSEGNKPYKNSDNRTVFDRIDSWLNISDIEIVWENNTTDHYDICYDEAFKGIMTFDARNLYESTFITKDGSLCIAVAKDMETLLQRLPDEVASGLREVRQIENPRECAPLG